VEEKRCLEKVEQFVVLVGTGCWLGVKRGAGEESLFMRFYGEVV